MEQKGLPRKGYPSDLTDEQWAIVEPLIPAAQQSPRGGRPREVDRREVLHTIFSLNRSGCQWDMLPHDVLPKSTVYDDFAQWRDDGTWAKIVKALRERTRVAAGREPTPSAACIDSQSVKTTAAILGEWLVILMNVSSPIAFRFRRYVWRQQQALSQRFSILRPPLFPRPYLLRAGCG